MADVKDKVVLITGSNSGIGEGIALHLAKKGSSLILTGRNKENLEQVVKKCKELGLDDSKILYFNGDISSPEHRENLIKKTIEKFGRLDVLVNNAGLTYASLPSSTNESIYDELMNVNLKAVFFLTQLAIPHLKETKGNIIIISSIVATMAVPQFCAYGMTKVALDLYTKCLAVELGSSGVRVNSISPGHIYSMIARRGNTPITDDEMYNMVMDKEAQKVPLGRIGNPEDIANAVAFLMSNEQASYISGENMKIDGAVRFASIPSL